MSAKRGRSVARTVAGVVSGEVARAVGPSASARRSSPEARQEARARSVRHALERLGPFYIKVGQILSTRPDLVPDYMITELSNLHDTVSVSPFSEFEPVLEDEMGRDWKRFFREVETTPVGTASLAQVYRVVLRNGERAVVKIQRPGVRPVVLDDMAMLRRVVRQIAKRAPDFNEVVDMEAMLEVIFSGMRPELDFTLEAANMDEFGPTAEQFETLAVPEVLFVTPRVLVQTLAPGTSIKVADPSAFSVDQAEAIGRDLLSFMFQGYFVDRKFHADPHPGNIFVHPDGRATLIDWGMIGKIDRNISTSIFLLMLNISLNDGKAVGRTWIELGRATRQADIPGFLSDMVGFIPHVSGASLETFNFGVQLTAIFKYSAKRGIATSPMIAMLGKSFANVEGSVRYLAPSLSLTDVFTDEFRTIAQQLAREMLSQEHAAQAVAQMVLGSLNGPEAARTLLGDLANREASFSVRRSGDDDWVDSLKRTAAVLAAIWLWRTRRRGPLGHE